ncbi:MAG TPA: hypothetical protein VF623_01245 [Segetibacter sp.]
MTNSRLLFCSRDLHVFMEANSIKSVQQLFDISIDSLVMKPDFPYRLLIEWVTLRDKFNLLHEN